MEIFGILDPDPHENLCGSEKLVQMGQMVEIQNDSVKILILHNLRLFFV